MTDAEWLARVSPPMTPALVVRRRTLEANLAAMQAECDAAGVRLRAHGKMHKCPTLGALQVSRGAVGLCCQTVGEAEAFAAGGIADLLVTAPVPSWGPPRLAALAARGHRVGLVADDEAQLRAAGAAAVAAGATLDLVVDIDLGLHRTGCPPSEAARLATLAASTPGLRFAGVQAYLGHLQHVPDAALRAELNARATDRLRRLVAELRDAGLPPAVVTGGGTGTFRLDLAGGVFTEIQAGSYALMDVEYLDCGAPGGGDWPFAPALFLAASVVSGWRKTHATCDAGLKALAVDGPAPRVVAGAAPGSGWAPLGDEHGAILHPAFLPRLASVDRGRAQAMIGEIDADPSEAHPADAPRPGGLVWLIPGHIDPTVNLHDALFVGDEDGRLERWPVAARRATA